LSGGIRSARDAGGPRRSHAVYRDGLGCYSIMVRGRRYVGAVCRRQPAQALLAEIAGPSLVAPATPLAAALDGAFSEPDHPPSAAPKAVVILKNSHIVAERYARATASIPRFSDLRDPNR